MLKQSKLLFIWCLILMLVLTGCSSKLKNIKTFDDLNASTIGVYTGSEYDKLLQEKNYSAKIAYYNSYSDQISALKSGKIDGFLSDEPLAKEIISKNNELTILDAKLTTDSYAFAINPLKDNLRDEINNQLIEMENNGILKSFEEKWMGEDESKKELDNYNSSEIRGTIKFATVSGSAPFAYMKNNKIVGYDIEVMSYICEKLEYKLEIIEMAFEGIIPALKSGKADVAGCSIIVTEERKKSVLFSRPDYTGGIVVVVRN